MLQIDESTTPEGATILKTLTQETQVDTIHRKSASEVPTPIGAKECLDEQQNQNPAIGQNKISTASTQKTNTTSSISDVVLKPPKLPSPASKSPTATSKCAKQSGPPVSKFAGKKRPPPPPPSLLRSKTGSGQQKQNVPILPPIPQPPAPPEGTLSKKLQWQNIPDSRTVGTVWERLLLDDEKLPLSLPHDAVYRLNSKGSEEWPSHEPKMPMSARFSRASNGANEEPLRGADVPHLDSLAPATSRTSFPMGPRFVTRLHLDYNKLTELFFVTDPSKDGGDGNAAGCRTPSGGVPLTRSGNPSGVTHVLDAKRRQNLEISLKGLGLLDSVAPLFRTVVDLVPFVHPTATEISATDCVSQENLQIVLSLYPTPEEEKLLKEAIAQKQRNPTTYRLGKAEDFLSQLVKLDDFCNRAQCCLVRWTLFDELSALKTKLELLLEAITRVSETLNAGAFRSLLALILRIGNYLNYGSRRGLARGFSWDSLAQLKGVKSVDGSTTLLRVMAETVDKQNPQYWAELQSSIGICNGFADSALDDAHATLAQLKKKTDLVEKEYKKRVEADPVFTKVFGPFAKEAALHLTQVSQKKEEVEKRLFDLMEMCGIDKKKGTKEGINLLKQFADFWKDLSAACYDNRVAEKKLREQAMRQTRRCGSQTARPTDLRRCSMARSSFSEPNNHTVVASKEPMSNPVERVSNCHRFPLTSSSQDFENAALIRKCVGGLEIESGARTNVETSPWKNEAQGTLSGGNAPLVSSRKTDIVSADIGTQMKNSSIATAAVGHQSMTKSIPSVKPIGSTSEPISLKVNVQPIVASIKDVASHNAALPNEPLSDKPVLCTSPCVDLLSENKQMADSIAAHAPRLMSKEAPSWSIETNTCATSSTDSGASFDSSVSGSGFDLAEHNKDGEYKNHEKCQPREKEKRKKTEEENAFISLSPTVAPKALQTALCGSHHTTASGCLIPKIRIDKLVKPLEPPVDRTSEFLTRSSASSPTQRNENQEDRVSMESRKVLNGSRLFSQKTKKLLGLSTSLNHRNNRFSFGKGSQTALPLSTRHSTATSLRSQAYLPKLQDPQAVRLVAQSHNACGSQYVCFSNSNKSPRQGDLNSVAKTGVASGGTPGQEKTHPSISVFAAQTQAPSCYQTTATYSSSGSTGSYDFPALFRVNSSPSSASSSSSSKVEMRKTLHNLESRQQNQHSVSSRKNVKIPKPYPGSEKSSLCEHNLSSHLPSVKKSYPPSTISAFSSNLASFAISQASSAHHQEQGVVGCRRFAVHSYGGPTEETFPYYKRALSRREQSVKQPPRHATASLHRTSPPTDLKAPYSARSATTHVCLYGQQKTVLPATTPESALSPRVSRLPTSNCSSTMWDESARWSQISHRTPRANVNVGEFLRRVRLGKSPPPPPLEA